MSSFPGRTETVVFPGIEKKQTNTCFSELPKYFQAKKEFPSMYIPEKLLVSNIILPT